MSALTEHAQSEVESDLDEVGIYLPLDRGFTVKRYPYRTAMVTDKIRTIGRGKAAALEHHLGIIAGGSPDNHTVFGITTGYNHHLYVLFSDREAVFGRSIDETPW